MPGSPSPQIDPVSAAVAVFTVFVSPSVATIAGAYSVIFLSAVFGSGWALMRREKKSILNAVGFILLMTGTATLTTVGLAQIINKFADLPSSNILLGPVALFIGGIGHDWPRVVPVLFNFTLEFLMKFKAGSEFKPPVGSEVPQRAKRLDVNSEADERAAEERYAGGDK